MITLSGNVSRAGQSWSHPWTFSRSCKHSHATCTHHPRQHWASTHPATSFSAHGVGSSNLHSFHRARTASSCTLTTRLASGEAVSNNIRQSQAQSSMTASEMRIASSPWNGGGDLQLPMQCYSCCSASAAVDASSGMAVHGGIIIGATLTYYRLIICDSCSV